jgi:hypothetical protein
VSARARPGDLVVFLGPSLSADEARAIAPCTVLPPAKAGDVFAILPRRPLAIALVDGLFEGAPSVWHHELLAALDAGVAVYGGASMGALRAAELQRHGMVGVGRIFGWYRDGVLKDDADVALYHAPASHGFRPLTLPLVDVRWAIVLAAQRDLLHPPQARAVLDAAEALHFGERTWDRILADARLSRRDRLLLSPFLRTAPSLKAEDARATIRAAAEWAVARRRGARLALPARPPPLPSHARRRRLEEARSVLADGASVRGADVLALLRDRPDAGRLAWDGLRHALLAAFARSLGLRADAALVERTERAWRATAGGRGAGRGRVAALAASGLDDGAARALFEELALEALLLERAAKVVADGPSFEEGLALAARLSGAWTEAVTTLAASPRASRASAQRVPSASASPRPAPRPRGRGAPTGASRRPPPSRRRGE